MLRLRLAALAAVVSTASCWVHTPRVPAASLCRRTPTHVTAKICRPREPNWRAATLRTSATASRLAATAEEQAEQGVDTEKPYPAVGDIVTYPGKWASEVYIGEVVNLQYIESRGKWIADLQPLEDIGEGQYERIRGGDTVLTDVDALRPVRAFYVRSTNAFKVMSKEGSEEPTLISDGYRIDNFKLPKKAVDESKVAATLAEYDALKARLLSDTLIFGAVCSVIAAATSGLENGAVFALGAATSAAYVYLLQVQADKVGALPAGADAGMGVSRKQPGPGPLDVLRLSLPLLLVGGLALANYARDPSSVRLLQLVPKGQFAAAMLAFVGSYRIPLLVRELTGAMRPEDLLATLPGSVGKSAELWRSSRSGTDAPASIGGGGSGESPVLVVSGPRGITRSALVERLLAEEPRLRRPRLWTSRPPREGEEVDGEALVFVPPAKMEELSRGGAFCHAFVGADGAEYGLRQEDLLSPPLEEGRVCVVDGDTSVVSKLISVEGAALVGIWISLGSLAEIEQRLRTTAAAAAAGAVAARYASGEENAPASGEAAVRAGVKLAIDDIEFGVTSGVFEFTALGADNEATMAKLRKAAGYALAAVPAAAAK